MTDGLDPLPPPQQTEQPTQHARPCSDVCRYGNAVVLVALAMWFLLIPGAIVVRDLADPHLREGGTSAWAVRLHRSLTPKHERWARQRLAGSAAEQLDLHNISGTEWPMFGSVFYLWATESLQEAWEKDHSLCPTAPKDYARGAVEAATALIADPKNAAWVKKHWGDDYLKKENLFYRALLISGLTSHRKLGGGDQYMTLLREQVEGLASELDRSPHGLLNDYPAQCYPVDVHTAIAIIRRADSVLGTDHAAFVKRAIRAFEGKLLDPVGLPPYAADPASGTFHGRSRGCGDSFVLIFAPELWPKTALGWYNNYERHFWQHRWTADGFREFPKDEPNHDWYADVDSGPVIAGHGIAACAFGVGAARANGRFDHAWPLSTEMLVTSWPLADGTLLGPRVLSNAIDAPYLGEAGVLFCLTREPVVGTSVVRGGSVPMFTWMVVAGYLGGGLLVLFGVWRGLRRWRASRSAEGPRLARVQFGIWVALVISGLVCVLTWNPTVGLLLLLVGQFLPRGGMRRGQV